MQVFCMNNVNEEENQVLPELEAIYIIMGINQEVGEEYIDDEELVEANK